ncbi:MAG: BrnT family toxin [Bryobacteraceae bacterium]
MGEEKRHANLQRHGIDFVRAKEIWQDPFLETPPAQTHHGEERYIAIGESQGRLIAVVFTWRGDKRRIISARVARTDERENYYKKIG